MKQLKSKRIQIKPEKKIIEKNIPKKKNSLSIILLMTNKLPIKIILDLIKYSHIRVRGITVILTKCLIFNYYLRYIIFENSFTENTSFVLSKLIVYWFGGD